MRTMKMFTMALAAVTMFASCSNENDSIANQETQLSIKLSGVVKTKSIEEPGMTTTGTIQVERGHIFIIDPNGNVKHQETLNVSTAIGNGQALSKPVASDSRVYIVCNHVEASFNPASLTTLSAIKAATGDITTQIKYKEAVLANSDGDAAAINLSGNTATATVSIKPVISRLELKQVKAKTETEVGAGKPFITKFTVKGVYIDGYYPMFTYDGGNSGAAHAQSTGTDFTNTTGDAGSWTGEDVSNVLTAKPTGTDAGKLWAQNVASGGVVRYIIILQDIEYNDGTGSIITPDAQKNHYITVKSYQGVSAFERGKIYRIGGDDGISFEPKDLGLTPNSADINLTVTVSVTEWVLETPNADI